MPPPGTWSLAILLIWSFGYTQAQSVTGQVVTVITTSTATALSDCTCTQTFSRPLTEQGISTTSDLDTYLSSTAGISYTDVSTTSSETSAGPTSVSASGTETNLPSTRGSIIPISSLYRLHVAHLPIRFHTVGLSDSHYEPDVHHAFPSANRLYLGMSTTLFMPTRQEKPEWRMQL
jgi:hypothetical protein